MVEENVISSVSRAPTLWISIAPVAKSTGPVKLIAPDVIKCNELFSVVDVVAV